MDRHSIQERNIEAYALGTLDAGDRQAFESHLLGCVKCERELASYALVVHDCTSSRGRYVRGCGL